MTKTIIKTQNKIEAIKNELQTIGKMRPGSLTKQFHKRGDKKWPYWQLSYMHKGKSKTNYVQAKLVPIIKEEVKEYKRFKKLMEKWIELSIILSMENMKKQNSGIKIGF
jgi:hypothetical protein